MNRIIKFRGKERRTGDWFYGHLFQTPVGEWKIKKGFREYLVKPDTVGQFTGLFDHNGKEIYEGDILKLEFSSRTCIEVVEFRDGRFVSVDPQRPYKADALYLWLNEATVIGNIHDNPELLKGGDYGRNS